MYKTAIFIAVFLFFIQSSMAEVRTLTNTRGVGIEAEVLKVSGGKVTIKRVSDGRTFEIPVNSLIPADQAWLKSFAAKPVTAKPGAKWLPLTVEFPLPEKYGRAPRVVGVGHSLTAVRTGASSYDLLLPAGAWVRLETSAFDGSSARPDHLVKFNGERNWAARINNGLLLLSRDSGAEEVAGISIPDDDVDFQAAIDQTRRYKPGISFSMDIGSGVDLAKLPDFGFPQTAAVVNLSSTSRTVLNLEHLIDKNIKALEISLYKQHLPELNKIKALEALNLRLNTLRDDTDPPPPLASLPQVKDLTLYGFPNDFTMHNTLLAQKQLRCLEISPKERGAVLFQGINGLKTLESLDVSSIQFEGSEFCALTNLRALTLSSDLFNENDAGLSELSEIKGLQHLERPFLPGDHLEKWAKSGALSGLERLEGGGGFSPRYSPGLKYVDYGSSSSSSTTPYREYARLAELVFFDAYGLEVDEWRTVATFKNRARMKAMDLSFNDLHFSFSTSDDRISEASLKKLASFENLRYLKMRSGKFKTMDFSLIPSLEHAAVDDDNALAEIRGLDEHKSLRSIIVDSCEFLKAISGSRDNHKLQFVELDDCPALTDVSGLNQAKNLMIVKVNKIDGLNEPQPFLESGQAMKIEVSRCKNLRDRRISR